jgi:hypothetical protein
MVEAIQLRVLGDGTAIADAPSGVREEAWTSGGVLRVGEALPGANR